jgi:hypothetical protein
MPIEAVLWVALGLTTMVSSVLAQRHPRALLTGRVSLGLLFFGWGFWLWSIPMLAAIALLLRAHLRATGRPH